MATFEYFFDSAQQSLDRLKRSESINAAYAAALSCASDLFLASESMGRLYLDLLKRRKQTTTEKEIHELMHPRNVVLSPRVKVARTTPQRFKIKRRNA